MLEQTVAISERNVMGFYEWNASRSPAIVLLHGIPGSAAVWSKVAETLAPEFRVIAPNLLGFGASSRFDSIQGLWVDSQARAVAALCEKLGVQKAVIVGHDYGGPVALALHRQKPELFDAFLLASANTFGDTPIPFPLSAIFWPGLGRHVERILFSRPSLKFMLKNGAGKPRPRFGAAAYLGDKSQTASIRTIFSSALRELESRYRDAESELKSLRVPTTVCWGSADPFFPATQAHRTAAQIPDAEVETFPEAGHFLPEERPAELATAIRKLIERAWKSG